MNDDEQIAAFANDLDKLVDRYARECDLGSAAVCGVLLMKIRLIQDDVLRRHDDGEDISA